MIAAIIQLLAGVEKEKIYEEYLSTNNYMKQQMEITEQAIRKMSFYRITPEKIKPLLEVRREYLEDILNKIFTKYGTLEDYLIKACEVDSEEIKKIKSIICE